MRCADATSVVLRSRAVLLIVSYPFSFFTARPTLHVSAMRFVSRCQSVCSSHTGIVAPLQSSRNDIGAVIILLT